LNTPYHTKALPSGTLLREWRLEHVLGAGGFGIVYRGRGVYFDELVAIKEYFPGAISDRTDGTTVTPSDSSSEEIYELGLKKFLEEAKVLWTLSQPERHPNIVSVRALFEIHGTAYMVMDFEEGMSLSQMLKDGRKFSERELLGLVTAIADGLDRAHRGGVIHRDIKPANILVDANGRPVLIDFGSARFDSGQATSTKVTFYTPPYAAIEQYVKTYPQGPWTDIYALGVVLYQCVTGEKPADALERMHGGTGEALSARERPGFSRAFTHAVDAALAIRPADRPQSLPEWLALFLREPPPLDDEATIIAVATPTLAAAPTAAPPPEATAPPAAVEPEPETEPAAAAAPAPASPKRGGPALWLVGAGVAAVLLAGGAAALLLRPHASTTTSAPAKAAPATTLVTAAPAAPHAPGGPSGAAVAQAADALTADARQLGRPAKELNALAAAQAQVDALARSGPPAQLSDAASGMAHTEAATLDRLSDAEAREAERMLGRGAGRSGGAAQALAALHRARAAVAAAASDVASAPDATAALAAARRAVAASGDFAAAYAAMTPFYASARQAEISAVVEQARGYAAQVEALAGGSKPWLFASQSRKQAYQLQQANAAKAKAEAASLDQLSQQAAATQDVRRLDATLAQASSLKSELAGLAASSAAARASASGPATAPSR
jgi:serine/threonine protein kinase